MIRTGMNKTRRLGSTSSVVRHAQNGHLLGKSLNTSKPICDTKNLTVVHTIGPVPHCTRQISVILSRPFQSKLTSFGGTKVRAYKDVHSNSIAPCDNGENRDDPPVGNQVASTAYESSEQKQEAELDGADGATAQNMGDDTWFLITEHS